jgi:hypothetical protein
VNRVSATTSAAIVIVLLLASTAIAQAPRPARRRCATEDPKGGLRERISREVSAFSRSQAAASLATLPTIQIPVCFHVITSDGDGDVPDARLQEQIAVLNTHYGQKGFKFTLESIDRTDNDSWFYMDIKTKEERAAKEKLGSDPRTCLNVYTADIEYLGWSTFPWELDGDPRRDGIVIDYATVPMSPVPPTPAPQPNVEVTDRGITLVHEAGHWLGLLHTFQDGCTAPNDEVGDTPAQNDGDDVFSCKPSLDTCPKDPGNDPVTNFMSYADDLCLTAFTNDQASRMKRLTDQYRRGYVVSSALNLAGAKKRKN